MSGVATAVIGSAVIGGVVATNSASKAAGASKAASDAQLAFEQQKLDQWNATYGSIQDNLAQYYSSLTPDAYEVQGLEAFQKEQQAALEKVRTTLAQRGLADSGVAAQAETMFAQQEALGRAKIRVEAPKQVVADQTKFLQIGLGQDPSGDVSRTLAQTAQNAQAVSQQATQQAGQAVGSAIQTTGTALADYLKPTAK